MAAQRTNTPRPLSSSHSPYRITPLSAFLAIIGVYSVGTVVWQTLHLGAGGGSTHVSDVLTQTKDAFIRPGSNNGRTSVANDGSWMATSTIDGDNADSGGGVLDSVLGSFSIMAASGGDPHSNDSVTGSIIPINLSVNYLQVIDKAPGAPPEPIMSQSATSARVAEDFLPMVSPDEVVFRWAFQARKGANHKDTQEISAYRIIVRQFGNPSNVAWDTNKVNVPVMPDSVSWGSVTQPVAGHIYEWKVFVWDAAGASSSSSWKKFAVGPQSSEAWEGKWIVHPDDMDTFDNAKQGSKDECKLWKMRRPLPIFRGRISSDKISGVKEIASALLVVSGLGSFRASFDGVPLSTSGPIDPPFTDYSKRVMYRGFDLTPFFQNGGGQADHTIGVTMGSGWWDHRPVSGMAKPKLLPRGPQTTIAQVIITDKSGHTHVIGQSGSGNDWQVTRGHIRESDLFTGEIVDLKRHEDLDGWDTPAHQQLKENSKIVWTTPVEYRTDVTAQRRHDALAKRAGAYRDEDNRGPVWEEIKGYAAPIGRLEPSDIPPILPMERIEPEEVRSLTNGRWLVDFGKSVSGTLYFSEGLAEPIVKDTYPRAHGYAGTEDGESFFTVVYGESLDMTTGDINRVLVAGMGLHDGGPRHVSASEGAQDNTPCFPNDHDHILTQRDVYVYSGEAKHRFATARQSHFTTHAFRFAEVCCIATPPSGVYALAYRTAMLEWGSFDSSNVLLNGGYELVKNAMKSNLLSVQSDCPHREKLPYGGDLVASSPAAMHMFDMSAFYRKTIRDWIDGQWKSGAYTETSIWQDLNDYAGIGKGAGETVWASAPPVLTVRHMQHYADKDLLSETLSGHIRWLTFLNKEFDRGLEQRGYDKELKGYEGDGTGLSDWLALRTKDTWLTHTAFYMASARAVAYIARKLESDVHEKKGMSLAKSLESKISSFYSKKPDWDFPEGHGYATPGPELGLFTRIVPADKRCAVLKNWFKRPGSVWPGDEERLFLNEVDEEDLEDMVRTGELVRESDGKLYMGWSQWQGFNEGILAMRYSLKTLSEFGFHNVALRKATGIGFGTPEYMLRHNATTMWESWWRSEDLYSRNHPMLGAMAEWMSSSAAGVSHYPTTTGGRTILFWPRFPRSAKTLEYASATQGTAKGDYSIAWRFEDLPSDKEYTSGVATIRVRFVVPPGGEGVYRPPFAIVRNKVTLAHAEVVPDMIGARNAARDECTRRRNNREGFPYSWEYDRSKEKWYKLESSKRIGTPCESFLFHKSIDQTQWGPEDDISEAFSVREDKKVGPGLYEVLIREWPLQEEVKGSGRIGNIPEYYNSKNMGSYCSDTSTAEWDIDDATHII
mmetsp:Transcript_10425/g.23827  ORF Transcript_10425/g.23827 Transcript_10425/m.23827 type:complete len:1340 (-) Transcript_10425:6-4025(-)